MELIFDHKRMVEYGDLNYLTNSAGDNNEINGKTGADISGDAPWNWIKENWAETYDLPCYGVTFFQKPGIMLSAEMYPETSVEVLPGTKEPDMKALCNWMAERAQTMSAFEALKGCQLFVLRDSDAACNGDPCHELCCFIPFDWQGKDIQKAIQCFTDFAFSYDKLTPELIDTYGMKFSKDDYRNFSTEILTQLERSAYTEYYKLATKPIINPSVKDLQLLEEATTRWEDLTKELQSRKIVLDFGNIVSELETRNLKLLHIKDNNGLFVVDGEGSLYGIETYYAGGYLDRFIGEKFTITFEPMEQPTKDFEDWRKEYMDASWVKDFIDRIVKKEYPSLAEPTFVLCLAATKDEYVNSNPSEVYEFDTIQDCIEECNLLRDSAKEKGLPDYFAAYIVAEDGSNPWNQVFADLKQTEECMWFPLSKDKCISVWLSPDKEYGDELAMKLEQRGLHGSMGHHCEVLIDERYTTSDLTKASIHNTLREIYQDANLPVVESELHSLTNRILSVFNLRKPSLAEQIKTAQGQPASFTTAERYSHGTTSKNEPISER